MPIVQIDVAEIKALAAFATANPPAGPVITAFLVRMQAAAVVAVKAAGRELFASGQEGIIYQAQVDSALARGVTQAMINKIVTATTGTVTPNPPAP
jgi:hypothetical protein